MKASKPFKKAGLLGVTQGFHSGHKAVDWVASYGAILCAPEKVKILGIRGDGFTPSSYTNTQRGYGVSMKGLESGREYLYWHCLPIFPVWGGDIIERGKIVAYMGNSGYVYEAGKYVSIEERALSPHRGTHLHYEVYDKGVEIDPLLVTDMTLEPTYTFADILGASTKVVTKIGKLLAR